MWHTVLLAPTDMIDQINHTSLNFNLHTICQTFTELYGVCHVIKDFNFVNNTNIIKLFQYLFIVNCSQVDFFFGLFTRSNSYQSNKCISHNYPRLTLAQ